MLDLNIEQIVFLLDNKNCIVNAAKILTKNCQTTKNGTTITYDAVKSFDDTIIVIDKSNIDDVWTSIDQLEKHLIDIASNNISVMLKSVFEQATHKFDKQLEQSVDTTESISTNNIDESIVKVKLPNGEIANIKL